MPQNEFIQTIIEKSRRAQKEFENFSQEQVDAVVREIARTVYDHAEGLARMAVDETRMGVYEDKVKKNQGKAKIIWNSLKNKKSVGILRVIEESGVVEIAKPMGVVGAVTPCTNPIVTPMCNAMFALKCRNSIIIAPHPRAKRCAATVVSLFNQAIAKFNAPKNLIQVIEEPTVELSNELMRGVDVIIATGGMGMVKAAYSSGKPAFGVGAGNIQCIIDRGIDFEEAIKKIITGRVFDNGIICSGEQMIIVHQDDFDTFTALLEKNDTYVVRDPAKKEALRKTLFVDGVMNRKLVGQSVGQVSEMTGLKIPEGTRMIAVESDGTGSEDLFNKEKMCPVIGLYKYRSIEEAVDIAIANLNIEGRGHSVVIHSDNKDNIEYAACRLPVSRVLVNQICATMNGGSFYNGFAATTTLGCGSWGNNSISENLDYRHLMNITRIGNYMKDSRVPSDEEIWSR